MDKDKQKARYIETRRELIETSGKARILMAMNKADSVNVGLLLIYDERQGKHCNYNTFNQWKDQGYTILKGSKAFAVWGQPKMSVQTPEGEKDEPEQYKYWPVCYLFSELQVIGKAEQQQANEPKAEAPKPEPEPIEMESVLM